jgi:hypothetical protein
MRAYSLDLREKIIAAYDRKGMTQRELSESFGVSLSFIEKLLRRRRSRGDIACLPHGGGRRRILNHMDGSSSAAMPYTQSRNALSGHFSLKYPQDYRIVVGNLLLYLHIKHAAGRLNNASDSLQSTDDNGRVAASPCSGWSFNPPGTRRPSYGPVLAAGYTQYPSESLGMD